MRAVITLDGASRLKCVCARGVANSLERSEANAASPQIIALKHLI